MKKEQIYILGIESSCDDTSAAVLQGTSILSNVIAGQRVHAEYGGVVPELASRAHQQNIIPVVDVALKKAAIRKEQLSAVAYTNGPGLLGSLLVGSSFAKAFAFGLGIPLLEIDHLQAHVLSIFADLPHVSTPKPSFPYLCLTVSGGHTLLLKVNDSFDMETLGGTIDDAAGEAFDKAAKILGLPYPGGPEIDRLAQEGNPHRFSFAVARLPGLKYSFSGLKTSFLYFIRDKIKENPSFIKQNLADLAASIQHAIVMSLAVKVKEILQKYPDMDIALSGGVSANQGLRQTMQQLATQYHRKLFLPALSLTTDNAAMIALCGYLKYQKQDFSTIQSSPYASTRANTRMLMPEDIDKEATSKNS
ncbi:MAG: tRNA (adenosine(37)-N6)-threonylcarbamoyltransferase complex transferase subunit TsaD [Bacteroidales bacterium]|jgi:N6-L-threonylcarbamoyladenine synthase|nr:tRNA (adenosine(37)-N6)-threonylcarbamoyltransferase complex transferase subunit TsaD [Bacteroidales bacterium]